MGAVRPRDHNHSGYMAIRGAIASGVNITHKILFNDAVAMTGAGRPMTAASRCRRSRRQVAAEGAKRVAVTDEPWKYNKREDLAARTHHPPSRRVIPVQQAASAGVTVLIYDQTCAAEKRRRRKRARFRS